MSLDKGETHPSGQGRKRQHIQVKDKRLKPKSAEEWAKELFSKTSNIKTCKVPLSTPKRVVCKRVYEAVARPFHRVGPARWLVIEKLEDDSVKYYVSNYPKSVAPKSA